MKQAVYSLCYHIVFDTDKRRPLIVPGLVEGLYRFFERTLRQMGGLVVGVGGIPNHVHILVRLPPSATVSDAVRILKAESTRWASKKRSFDLTWGDGFGAFSVGKAQAPDVLRLLHCQESHHLRRSYAHELLALMNGIVEVLSTEDGCVPAVAHSEDAGKGASCVGCSS